MFSRPCLKPAAILAALFGAIFLPSLGDARLVADTPVATASGYRPGLVATPSARVLRPGAPLTIPASPQPQVFSLRLALADGARATLNGGTIRLERRGAVVLIRAGDRTQRRPTMRPVHIQATITDARIDAAVNRHALGTIRRTGDPVALVTAQTGRVSATDILVTSLANPVARLVQRLAALRAATPA
ncbi:MAG: hypothetical protein ACEQSX_21295, partial [Baekduiaceae bacterium]